jgi:hypothetical protein
LENIKYAIAKQELVQEKFDEKKIMYFLSKVPEGDRADINYMQRIVNTFINSVFVYEDRVVICHNFDGDEELDFLFIVEAKYPVITGFLSQSVGIMQK